jgi:hypothetical protein
VAPSPAAALRFATPARTSVAGQCSGAGQPVVISLLDAFGQPTQASQDLALSLGASPPDGFQVFADDQCATPLVAAVVPAGAASITVWFGSTHAGAISISATAASLLPATQGATVLAGPPAALAFVSTPQTVNAGGCSQPAVVEVRDAWGNPTPPGSASIDLSVAPASGAAFYSDSSCTTAATSAPFAVAGGTQAQFWFQGTTAQPVTITASAVSLGVPTATQDELITPQGSASQLVFLTPPRAPIAGSCSDLVTIQAQDSFGNAVAGAGAVQVGLSAAPGAGFAFYSDPSCGLLIAGGATQIGSGQSTTGVYFRGTVAGTVQITASSTTLTDAFQAEMVLPAAPSQLAFASAAQSLAAGACSGQAALALLDPFGNVAVAGAPVAVALGAAPAAGFAFYSDASCTLQVSGVTVAAGGSGAAFHFKGTTVGTVTVSATASGLAGASQDEQLYAATPDRLAFTTAPQTLPAGGCSGAVALVARDALGNPAPVSGATPVALSALPPAGFGFFGDAACSTAIGSVTIAAGSTTASFFFRGTAPGSVGVTASAAGLASATQAETITPAAPDHLAFTTGAQALAAGACSAAATVQSQDAYGNVAPVATATTVSLSASPPAGFTLYSDSGCTSSVAVVSLAAGTSTVGFWFKATVPGTVAITASAAALGAAAQAETVTAAPADHLAFTSAPQTKQAGACSAQATIQSQDPYGNPSAVATATAVSLSAAPAAGFAFYADAGCTAAVASVSIAAGASGAGFWFKGTAPGSIAAGATAAGLTGATQTETVTPAAPDHLSFTTAPQTKQAGDCSAQAAIQVQDPYGNPSAVAAAATVNLSAAPAAGFGFYSDASCTTSIGSVSIAAGASTASFWFKGTAPGSVAVTAAAAGLTAAAQAETITPAPANHLAFTTAPQTKQAGECSAQATIQTQDPYGNASAVASATTVALSASPAAGFGFYSDPYCTVAIGSVSIAAGASAAGFYLAGTAPGNVTVTASAAGLTGATQIETVVPGAPDHLTFTAGPQTVAAGACSAAVTLQSRDASGNASPVAAATAVSLSAAPAAGFAFYSDSGCTTVVTSVSIAAGASAAGFWFKGTFAGSVPWNVTVTAAAAGLSPSPTQVETVNPAPPDRVVFTTAPQSATSGQCSSPATLQAQDPYGNASPVSAATAVTLTASPAAGFAFYAGAGCAGAPVGAITLAAGTSTATFSFAGTTGGFPTAVTVTAAPSGLTAAVQSETINPVNTPTQLVFTTPARTASAGGCSGQLTVQSQDSFGVARTVSAATPVNLSAAPATGFTFYSDAGCTAAVASVSIAAGASAASFWFKGTAAGNVGVTAAASGLTSATQTETVSPAAPGVLLFTTASQTRQAGQCSAVATVQSQDPYGNVSPVVAATTVSLSASPAGLGFYSDAGCTVAVASVSMAAGASTAGFWFKGTAVGSVVVTASATGLTSATQTETINPAGPSVLVFASAPQTRQAGACSAAATVQSQDSYGNVSAVSAATAVNLVAAPAAGFAFYSDAGCTSAVTSVSMAAGASTAGFWFKGTAPGSITVTASATGFTAATQVETVNPAPPNHLAFTTGAQTRQAGACSAVATVQTQDAYNNASPVGAATTVSLSASPATGFTFYSNATCTVAVGSVSIAAGASTAGFYFKGTAPGSVTVTASATGLTSATQGETITVAPPDHLAFATGPQAVAAGSCSAAAALESRDPYNNVSAVTAATTVSLSAAPATGFTFYSNAGCTVAVSSVSIAAGASTASFWFKGTAAGSVTVTASAAGMTPNPTQVETVNASAPDRLVFTTGAQTRQAGACSAVATVQSQDPYNNVSPVGAATTVSLAASPATGFTFYSNSTCSAAVTSASIAAGASTAIFYFKGTVAGSVVVTAAVAGWTLAATQTETVSPASTDHLAWAAIPSPQAQDVAFGVTVRAVDLYGNVTPAFAGTATLSIAPARQLTCASGCTSGLTTGAFAAGIWTGSVSVGGGVTGATLTATSGAIAGTSAAFNVNGASNPSPPIAKFTASPVVIRAGQTVSFDASASSDYQDPTSLLQVSWDFAGTSTGAPAYPTPAAPWTAWTTTKTTTHSYATAGTYAVRLAVVDTAGTIGHATLTVVVLAAGDTLCTVTTAADADDGATSCAGPYGTDGKLSLPEAIRLVPAGGTITFSGPMTVTGSGSYTLGTNMRIAAPSGVILDTKALSVNATVVVSGLEITRQPVGTPIAVAGGGALTLEDVYLHDSSGVSLRSDLTLTRTRVAACTADCIRSVSGNGKFPIVVRYSEFRDTPAFAGVALDSCSPSGKSNLDVAATVFARMGTGIRLACNGSTSVQNNTFVANATGVDFTSGGLTLQNNVFTGQTTTAINCGSSNFNNPGYHLLYQNASNGCIASDPNTIQADPLYIFAAASDYRLLPTSPALNSALDVGLYLLPAFPAAPGPRFLGAGPDRGGRETY